jgi:hypothetical protein
MSKSKNKSISRSDNIPNQGQDSLLGLFARMFWSLIGNAILFFLAAGIYRTQTAISIFDIEFLGVVLLLIIVRYLDIKYLKGVTVEGLPATMEHWRKYVKHILLISSGLWILAHILSFLKK